MTHRIRTSSIAAVAVAAMGLGSIARAGDSCQHKKVGKDIIDTAVGAGSFNTLAKALTEAGLVEALKGKGPFTVFAPTDEAFAKLPKGTLEALLKDLPKLRSILKYHVVSGQVMAADVVKLTSAKTLLGQTVSIDTANGVKINNATVTKTDIACSNGVIHVIDTVILPKDDIIDTARAAGSFKTLLTAIEAAGLMDDLRGEGPLTVFAPTDEAFGKLPAGTVEALLKDKAKLKSILAYHVVPGSFPAKSVSEAGATKTLQGTALKIGTSGDVTVNNAKLVKADVNTSNGVIHVIDTVLIPI